MFGFDRGLHETVSGAVLHFLISAAYAGRPDLMRQALTSHAVHAPASGGRTAVPAAPAGAPRPIPAEARAEEEPEPIAA